MAKKSKSSSKATVRHSVTKRNAYLQRVYGITEKQYQNLLEKQNNSCAVCLKHRSKFKTNLAVDHNHISGEIRGLLCNYCNRRMVGRHRDSVIVRRIADYLDQGTGWIVPVKKKKKRKKQKK